VGTGSVQELSGGSETKPARIPESARLDLASFGEQLRQAREAKQITLQDISAATKISTRALQAMEDEQFDRLPGGIFNKGFVRAYARYVGLDEEKMLSQYLAAAKLEPVEPERPNPPPPPPKAGSAGWNGIRVISLLAVAVGLLLGWLWWKEHRREQREVAPASTAQPAAASTNASAAVPQASQVPAGGAASEGSSASAGAAQSASAAGTEAGPPKAQQAGSQSTPSQAAAQVSAPVEITITATEPSWISVRRDGGALESVTLDPASEELRSRSYQAQKELRLVAGNPRAVTVTFNGKPVPAEDMGPTNHPARILFTPQGMEHMKSPEKADTGRETENPPGADDQPQPAPQPH
jgi:cytoskeleton protein RodZ